MRLPYFVNEYICIDQRKLRDMLVKQLNIVNSVVIDKNNNTLNVKFLAKKVRSQLVKVTIEEINAVRPSVYKYLLP